MLAPEIRGVPHARVKGCVAHVAGNGNLRVKIRARRTDFRLFGAEVGEFDQKIRTLGESQVDQFVHRIPRRRGERIVREISHLKMRCRQDTEAVDQCDLGVALRAQCGFELERELRGLLLRLKELGLDREPIVEPGLHRLLDRLRRAQRAPGHGHLLPCIAKIVKIPGDFEDYFLMRRVKADIGHHQLLLRGIDQRPALAEVDQQPLDAKSRVGRDAIE